MIEPTIKSRPVYGTLKARAGLCHILVADGEGAAAILDMSKSVPGNFFEKAVIEYVLAGEEAKSFSQRLVVLKPAAYHPSPTIGSLLPRLTQTLAVARMGTRLYLAGTEGLIGQAMKVAVEAGMDHASITSEHRGSLARRVQCVHCKGITENATTQPFQCAHCGLMLLVRDHYSRRIAAFQGVCIDAEVPGDVPSMERLFS